MSQGRKAAERLAGKTVLITGASAGIGQATAIEFCDASNGNVKLILVARRVERLEELKRKIEEGYPQAKVHPLRLDVSNTEEVQGILAKLPEEFKDIDVLVNNAGFARGKDKVGEIDMEGVEAVFKTNVLGLIALTQVVLPIFKAKNSGDIINIGSIAGRDAAPSYSIYCSSKFAVKAFTSALLKELIDTKIRVIEIAPGFVKTEFSAVAMGGDERLARLAHEGYERLRAEDVAEAVVYASSRQQNAVITEIVLMPSAQGSPFHLHRSS